MSTHDLFGGSPNQLEALALIDADVSISRHFLEPEEAELLFGALRTDTPWAASEIQIWGKRLLQPRLICWYGDPGAAYRYSGVSLKPLAWTPLLCELKDRISNVVGARFNSVLLNLYRDQNDSMGWHSDDEVELGMEPTIASISLGETRDFLLKHKTRKALKPARITLRSGSLLVMKGLTQKNWVHSIQKETRPLGERINLTFREILPARRRKPVPTA